MNERDLEMESAAMGAAKFFANLEKAEESGRDTPGAARIQRKMMEVLVPHVRALQREGIDKAKGLMSVGGRSLQGWEMPLAMLDTVKLAYITVRVVMAGNKDSQKHNLASAIGNTVNLEIRWQELREAEAKAAKAENRRNRANALRATVKEVRPANVRKWLKQIDDIETTHWDYETRVKVGVKLLELVKFHLSDYVDVTTINRSSKNGATMTYVRFTLTEAVQQEIEKYHREMADCCLFNLPMVEPPHRYTKTDKGWFGGYHYKFTGLIKPTQLDRHTMDVDQEYPQPLLNALDAIQQTKWRINDRVLEVAHEALERRLAEVLPVAPRLEFPPRMPTEQWEALSKEEKGKYKHNLSNIHAHNERLESKRAAMRRVISCADKFREEPCIYFPHNLDFRGRAYPLPGDLHPQGDDFTRSMLTLATGKPLGASGLRWLCHAVAAYYGEDKIALEAQVDWVTDHLNELHVVAQDPLGAGYEMVTMAEEPWQFMAAAMELDAAFASGSPYDYVSCLPVFVDGSCNGLQHLSAMGRDPVGAKAVNLMDGPRQDIYQDVADKVISQVEDDLEIDNTGDYVRPCDRRTEAHAWQNKVTRKTVKRGVMTVPYGVTKRGMRDQLLTDRLCDDLEGDKMENANYMQERMAEAIDTTVVKAREIMEWLQNAAAIMAEDNKPFDWHTPAGLVVRQAYYADRVKIIKTVMGMTWVRVPDPKVTIKKRKQALSIAPNVIHSFDAAHMMLTIDAAREEIDAFAVIHDSFGTHAADIEKLGVYLRDQFADIYATDWLTSLSNDMEASYGRREHWMTPPRMGDFDVTEVRKSSYFFF